MRNSVPMLDTASDVLAFAREQRATADAAESRLLQAAVTWSAMHSVDSLTEAATMWVEQYGDTGVPIAGPGAPLVGEFAICEFAAAVGLSTDAGRALLGEAMELRYRLPQVWRRVVAGDLVSWKARRIARATMGLSPEAAAHVDRHLAFAAHRVGPIVVDRLVQEAIDRFMPQEAEQRRQQAADTRHFTIGTADPDLTGLADVWARLDLADAHDLEAAISAGAEHLKALGSTASLDVRRSQAAGELARRQQALDLAAEPGEPGVPGPQRAARQVVLYVHLSEAAVTGSSNLGRLEQTRSPISAEQVRDWCGNPDTSVVVKPVIDLNDRVHTTAYEVPDRIAERVRLVDQMCVFPWCTRPARGCDLDHIEPYDSGGQTATDNLAPLCRQHHRLKTHSAWSYTRVEDATYLWRSPHGYQFLRDHLGTVDVSTRRGLAPPQHPLVE